MIGLVTYSDLSYNTERYALYIVQQLTLSRGYEALFCPQQCSKVVPGMANKTSARFQA